MLIFLIGMPGSGKTTLGLQLAKQLRTVFLDIDLATEAEMGMTISEAFNSKGEDFFRKAEKEVLQNSIEISDAVIATGGGTPCFYDNLQVMNNTGLTIFLEVSSTELIARVAKTAAQRPLLAGQDLVQKIDEMYRARRSKYEKAHLKLASDNITVQDLINLIKVFKNKDQK